MSLCLLHSWKPSGQISYIHTYTSTYTYMHMHICTYICLYACIHINLCAHIDEHRYTCKYIYLCAHTGIYTCMHIHMCMRVRQHVCTHMDTYIYTYLYLFNSTPILWGKKSVKQIMYKQLSQVHKLDSGRNSGQYGSAFRAIYHHIYWIFIHGNPTH